MRLPCVRPRTQGGKCSSAQVIPEVRFLPLDYLPAGTYIAFMDIVTMGEDVCMRRRLCLLIVRDIQEV